MSLCLLLPLNLFPSLARRPVGRVGRAVRHRGQTRHGIMGSVDIPGQLHASPSHILSILLTVVRLKHV